MEVLSQNQKKRVSIARSIVKEYIRIGNKTFGRIISRFRDECLEGSTALDALEYINSHPGEFRSWFVEKELHKLYSIDNRQFISILNQVRYLNKDQNYRLYKVLQKQKKNFENLEGKTTSN